MTRDQWIRETRAGGSGLGLVVVYGLIIATMIATGLSVAG